jgi:glycine cleavage system aminomethyltransferase T
MPPGADPAFAVRQSAVVSRVDDVTILRFRGPGARDAVDRLCAGPLRGRDGQLQHLLLLDEQAHCFADAYVLCDDDEYELLLDGPEARAAADHVAGHVPRGADVEIEDRTGSHAAIALDGPFAWELLSRVAGAEAVGLPYLTFFHGEGWTCCRAGRTGEYGYLLEAPGERAAELHRALLEAGAALDAVEADRAVLDQCALENLFFNPRREGREPVTPIELQLQWRVDYAKQSLGMDALRRHRAAGAGSRLTTLVAPRAVAAGDPVRIGAARVGRVLSAGWSVVRGDCVLLALLDLGCAHPGIRGFEIGADEPVPGRSVTPPLLNNRSLFVSPQLHTYATRGELRLPPLVRP